jgi:hypothetical protein
MKKFVLKYIKWFDETAVVVSFHHAMALYKGSNTTVVCHREREKERKREQQRCNVA